LKKSPSVNASFNCKKYRLLIYYAEFLLKPVRFLPPASVSLKTLFGKNRYQLMQASFHKAARRFDRSTRGKQNGFNESFGSFLTQSRAAAKFFFNGFRRIIKNYKKPFAPLHLRDFTLNLSK